VLPLESFLQLLAELEQMAVSRAKSPPNRDAFELGHVNGLFAAQDWLDSRIRELVQQQQGNEDDE
jgi:hypothetical protein